MYLFPKIWKEKIKKKKEKLKRLSELWPICTFTFNWWLVSVYFTFRNFISENRREEEEKKCETKVRNVDKKKTLMVAFTAAENAMVKLWTKTVQTKGHAKQLSQSVFIMLWLAHAFCHFDQHLIRWSDFIFVLFFLIRFPKINYFYFSSGGSELVISRFRQFLSVITPNYGSTFCFIFVHQKNVWFPWPLVFCAVKKKNSGAWSLAKMFNLIAYLELAQKVKEVHKKPQCHKT